MISRTMTEEQEQVKGKERKGTQNSSVTQNKTMQSENENTDFNKGNHTRVPGNEVHNGKAQESGWRLRALQLTDVTMRLPNWSVMRFHDD